MRCFCFLLAAGCLATAVAQEWQVELVDTLYGLEGVFVKRDAGQTYVAYVAGDGGIRIAIKDTVWHYETLDTALVRPDAKFHFALGPAGRMAVSGLDDSYRPVVVEKSDTGWNRIWTRATPGVAMAVYGADSVPAVVYGSINQSGTAAYVIVETWLDSVWHVDTAVRFEPSTQYVELELYDADCSQEAGPCFLNEYGHGLPKSGQSPWQIGIYKGYRSGEGWSLVGLGGGTNAVVYGFDITAGGSDTASAAVYSNGYSRFDGDPMWPGRVTDAAVQTDSARRPLMAFITPGGDLQLAFKTGFWHFYDVPGAAGAQCCDLALDEYGQPLIVYENGAELWFAKGIDVVSIDEDLEPRALSREPEPTVLSGSSVQGLASKVIFDALGRRVLNPRSGIFFVRDEGRWAGDAGRIRKVVIAR